MSTYSIFTINDILLNRESLQKKNKYSCPICFEFIYKKSIYQCRSGHYACKECWEKSLENKKECMICRLEVNSFKDLSRCLIIEQNFGKKQCYYQRESHLENDCNNSIIPCKYYEYGCKIETKRSNLQNHLNNVNHQIFMGLLIDKLSSTLAELNKTQDELVKKIEQSEKTQEKHCQEINELQIKNDNLSPLITKMDGTYQPTYKNKWRVSNLPLNNMYGILNINSQPFNFENQEFHLILEISRQKFTLNLKTNALFDFKYISFSLPEIYTIHTKNSGWLNTDNELTIKIFIKKLNINNNNSPLKS
ncbi:hypothetical protein ACTFIZ_011954 [Dictyostelium cf. discoideum]